MNRPVFRKKANQSQTDRVDRFVLPRESFVDDRMRRTRRVAFENQTVDIWQAKHQKQKKYKKYLDDVLGLDPIKGLNVRNPDKKGYVQAWPCVPRKRGYLSSADSILDLPTYSYATFPELLDWSSSNMLVAALGYSYHLFSWQTQSVTSHGFTACKINCCKFDPKGDFLLMGTNIKDADIHDVGASKRLYSVTCPCYSRFTFCGVTAIDWSPTGNSFVTGCSRGIVVSIDHRSEVRSHSRRISSDPILSIRISPDARYVAAINMSSPTVHVLVWPNLEYHSSLNSNWIVQTIAWHPWRSALLGVGVITSHFQTTIAMWDTPCSRLREAGLGLYNNFSLDVMLFSHRTGELVLSLWNSGLMESNPSACSQLLVMSDPYTVVDQSGEGKYGMDRVRTMVFNPDGTKLATATLDEDLIIWNFLSEDKNSEKKKKNMKSRRFCAMPVYLDMVSHGFVIR